MMPKKVHFEKKKNKGYETFERSEELEEIAKQLMD